MDHPFCKGRISAMIKSGTNSLSMFMQRNFNRSMQNTEKAVERITTGKRVNSASDDIGAFYQQNNMVADERSKRMAVRNLEHAFNLYEQANNSLEEVYNATKRMRQWAVQAANETLNDDDRQNIQFVFDELKTAINQIATTSNYNNQKLLAVNKVDLGLLVDVSGSMGSEQQRVRDSIGDVAQRIQAANINLKLGVAEMGDASFSGGNAALHADALDGTDRTADLSEPDSTEFQTAVDALSANGALVDPYASLLEVSGIDDRTGENDPDAFSWRADSVSRLIVLITDTNDETNVPSHSGGHTETGTASQLANGGFEVHVIGNSSANGATDEITSATGGSFNEHDSDGTGNLVGPALNNIADDLISKYGGGEALNLRISGESGEDGALVSSLASNITTAALGLRDSSVLSIDTAQTALDQIDSALNSMEYIRGNIGAEVTDGPHRTSIRLLEKIHWDW